uniref:Uncharacterized protein n=1 Tax=Guillardia theta TaxID=55529 RepID=A0A7S4JAR2_GUITH
MLSWRIVAVAHSPLSGSRSSLQVSRRQLKFKVDLPLKSDSAQVAHAGFAHGLTVPSRTCTEPSQPCTPVCRQFTDGGGNVVITLSSLINMQHLDVVNAKEVTSLQS